MSWAEVQVITNCKIRAYTSVASDVGRVIQIIKDGIILKEKTYTATLILDFELPGKSKYTVKDLTSGYTQDVMMDAGAYAEVETGLTTSTWEGINRIIKAGRTTEFLEVGDIFPVITQSGKTFNMIVAGINAYGNNEVSFVSKELLPWQGSCNAYYYISNYIKPQLEIMLGDLPVSLQSYIATKSMQYYEGIGNGTGAWIGQNFKVWPLSMVEVGGANSGAVAVGHKPLPYFATNASRLFTKQTGQDALYGALANCTAAIVNAGYGYSCIALATGALLDRQDNSVMAPPWGFEIRP